MSSYDQKLNVFPYNQSDYFEIAIDFDDLNASFVQTNSDGI